MPLHQVDSNVRKKKKKKKKNTTKKLKSLDKNSDIFHISAQNIDCGFLLEPPWEALILSTHILCFGAKIRKTVN